MKALAQSYQRLARSERWVMAPMALLLAVLNLVRYFTPVGHWIHLVMVLAWLVAAALWWWASRHAYRAAQAMLDADAALQRLAERNSR